MAFDELIPARRKAILDTVIAYIRDRQSPSSYYRLQELARELPISRMAAAGAMTHLEEHGPYTVRRDDVGGEIAWFVSGMIG